MNNHPNLKPLSLAPHQDLVGIGGLEDFSLTEEQRRVMYEIYEAHRPREPDTRKNIQLPHEIGLEK